MQAKEWSADDGVKVHKSKLERMKEEAAAAARCCSSPLPRAPSLTLSHDDQREVIFVQIRWPTLTLLHCVFQVEEHVIRG